MPFKEAVVQLLLLVMPIVLLSLINDFKLRRPS